jgi:hypothetical protein
MTETAKTIAFALISHTNNGKTTLARTLLGADVGEIRDAAHVTVSSESHTLLETPSGAKLRLWDTPGFGDSVRLSRRLALSDNPIGWFLREIIDRYRDRPLWLSQHALRTAREESDIVLYLVNSSEHPKDAGYLGAEMKILEWLGKPVVVLLNQMGPPRPAPESEAEQRHWRDHLDQYGVVRKVLPLDAFARCWVHERVFYEAVAQLIPSDKDSSYAELLSLWRSRNVERFRESMRLLAKQVAAAAQDHEPVETDHRTLLNTALQTVGVRKGGEQRQQEKAMNALLERLERTISDTTGALLELHQLDKGKVSTIHARVQEHFVINKPVDQIQAGLLGAILSGAATGLSADLLAGGMTAGAGAVVGGLVGAVTFAGAARGFNASKQRTEPEVQFKDDFLLSQVVASVLRYLAVIHYGRGRGNFVESETPSFWQGEVEEAANAVSTELANQWTVLRRRENPEQAASELERTMTAIVRRVLGRLYPGADI